MAASFATISGSMLSVISMSASVLYLPSEKRIEPWAAVYGTSDKTGAYVKDRPVRPQDLGATIYHALGVSLDTRLGKDGAVPRPITTGEPLLDLFD